MNYFVNIENNENHENPFGQVETCVSDVVYACFRL